MNERMTKKEEHLALSVAGKDIRTVHIYTCCGNVTLGLDISKNGNCDWIQMFNVNCDETFDLHFFVIYEKGFSKILRIRSNIHYFLRLSAIRDSIESALAPNIFIFYLFNKFMSLCCPNDSPLSRFDTLL